MKRPHDIMGVGGNIYRGWRTVRKGGRFKFDNFWFSHPKLEHLVGHTIEAVATDAFYSETVGVHHETLGWLCNAKNDYHDSEEYKQAYARWCQEAEEHEQTPN